jgi:lipopolysaccharide transport system permease protein
MVNNQGLIRKVYFPRLLIPLSTVLSSLVDFAVGMLLLAAMMAWFGLVPGWRVLALPGFLLLAVAAAVAAGLWLSALNLRYRDFRHLIPLFLQLGMFVSPVVYTTSAVVPERYRLLYGLNPMAGVIEGFRWALLGRADAPGLALLPSIAVTLLLLGGGLLYFTRTQKDFADLA